LGIPRTKEVNMEFEDICRTALELLNDIRVCSKEDLRWEYTPREDGAVDSIFSSEWMKRAVASVPSWGRVLIIQLYLDGTAVVGNGRKQETPIMIALGNMALGRGAHSEWFARVVALLPKLFGAGKASASSKETWQVKRKMYFAAWTAILESMREVAKVGFRGDVHGETVHLFPRLCWVVNDNPEGCRLSGVKDHPRTVNPCRYCHTPCDALSCLPATAPLRNAQEVTDMQERLLALKRSEATHETHKQAIIHLENKLKKISVHPWTPGTKNPFFDTTNTFLLPACDTLGAYGFFPFEALHQMSLGIVRNVVNYVVLKVKKDNQRLGKAKVSTLPSPPLSLLLAYPSVQPIQKHNLNFMVLTLIQLTIAERIGCPVFSTA
jgi:hypothetical protein